MTNLTPEMERVVAALRARLNKKSQMLMTARSGTWWQLT